jgi:hypothetical protein
LGIKKSKEIQFAFQDASGAIRAIHVQVLHLQEKGQDRIQVIATSDGVPIEATARIGASRGNKVKTKSRL